jgi:hypothetical protein
VVEHVDEIFLALSWSVRSHGDHGSSSLLNILMMM